MDLPIIERTDPYQTLLSTVHATHKDDFRLLEIRLNDMGVEALNSSPHDQVHNIFSNGYFEGMLFKVFMPDGAIAKTEIKHVKEGASGVLVLDVDSNNKIFLRLPPPFNVVQGPA